jgi:hypothetical protein
MVTPSSTGLPPEAGGVQILSHKMISGTIQRLNDSDPGRSLPLMGNGADGPRLRLSPLRSFATYGPRIDAGEKLRYLLEHFRFGMLRELMGQWQSA